MESLVILDVERQLDLLCERNPKAIPLHVAENVLLAKELSDHFAKGDGMKEVDFKYQSSQGTDALRASVAAFLNRSFQLQAQPLSKDHVSLYAGTRCALEMAAAHWRPTAEPPRVLIPTPCWQGFEWIYPGRLGARIVPVPVDRSWNLTFEAITRAYQANQPHARALVLTNPMNPLGYNIDPVLLERIVTWVLNETPMDVVSDEIYAHCQTRPLHESPFRSVLRFGSAMRHPKRVHVAWGFAKDFGVSGFRVGVLASRDALLHKAAGASHRAGFSPMTSSNSYLLAKLFEPGQKDSIADDLMRALQPRLKGRFDATRTALRDAEIPFFAGSDAAQFVWLDLHRWLPCACPSDGADLDPASQELLDQVGLEDDEKRLLQCLITQANVCLLPGTTLRSPQKGFFRLCHTAVDLGSLQKAIQDIGCVLARMRCP